MRFLLAVVVTLASLTMAGSAEAVTVFRQLQTQEVDGQNFTFRFVDAPSATGPGRLKFRVRGDFSVGVGDAESFDWSIEGAAGASNVQATAANLVTSYDFNDNLFEQSFDISQAAMANIVADGIVNLNVDYAAEVATRFSANPFISATLSYQQNFRLPEAEKALHASRANDARLSLATLDLFGALSTLGGSVGEAVALLIGQFASSEVADLHNVGTVISTVLGLLVGAALGPEALAIASAYAITGAYYAVTQAVETRLANDPPRYDYTELYEYEQGSLGIDFGLGAGPQAYFEDGFLKIRRLSESTEGALVSLERGQGAEIDGDELSAALQANAFEQFSYDYSAAAREAGNWFTSLPQFLNNYDSAYPAVRDRYPLFVETGQKLGAAQAPVPEPSTWLTMVVGFGVIGASVRKHKQTSTPTGAKH